MESTNRSTSREVGDDGVHRTWVRWPLGAISLAVHGDLVALTIWEGPRDGLFGHRAIIPRDRLRELARALESLTP